MTEDSPDSARFAPNGYLYTAVLCLDFNSMYLWSQEQDEPLTAGLRWLKNGVKFHKKYLSTCGSFVALQWLYYRQALLDEAGINVTIQHQYHQGEATVEGYQVDGYAVINGQRTVFEFNGKTLFKLPLYISISIIKS